MPCYVLQAGDTDRVKIGWANDVEARRIELQTAHWEDLRVIRVIDSDPWVERAMHRRFADQRIKREWFAFHPEMLVYVPEKIAAPTIVRAPLGPVGAIIKSLGGSGQVSSALGVNRNTIIYWAHRKRIPSDHWNALTKMAADRNIKGIDSDVLLKACKARKRRQPQEAAA